MASSPPSIPPDLKPIAPYLARAHELATAEPIISYWCTYHALQQAMSIGSQNQESQVFLLGLMDKLETVKAENSTNEAFSEDTVASAYVENFGLKLFSQADNEDRKGKSTRLTARKFLAAANFLEVLSIFGELSAENRDKIKYGKWKAADIAKAFREGRTPVPGPAGGLSPEEEEKVDPSKVSKEEEKELSRELAALGTPAGLPTDESTTPAKAPLGSDEAPEADDDEPESYPFPQHPTTLPSAPSAFPSFPSGPFAPSAPSDDDAPPDFNDVEEEEDEDPAPTPPSHAATPAPPSFLNSASPSRSTSPLQPSGSVTPQITETHQTRVLHPPPAHDNSLPPAFASAVFPPAAAPSLPPAPPPLPSVYAAPPPLPPAPVSVAVAPAPIPVDGFDILTVGKVQKHARWAISALDYEDWETARKELRAALAMLGG